MKEGEEKVSGLMGGGGMWDGGMGIGVGGWLDGF